MEMKVDMEYLKERISEKMDAIKECDIETEREEIKKLENLIRGLERFFDITTHEQTEELLEVVKNAK